jgi:hypothetical protein
MSNLPNLHAEAGADLIGDDAQPTLILSNTSTGAGLESRGLAVVSTASIDVLEVANFQLTGAIPAANATVVAMEIDGASRASGAVLKFTQGLVSLTSVLATTGGVAGTYGLRVVRPDGSFGWIPIYPDGAVTGAAL